MNKKLLGFKYISWQRVIIQEYVDRKKMGKTARDKTVHGQVKTKPKKYKQAREILHAYCFTPKTLILPL